MKTLLLLSGFLFAAFSLSAQAPTSGLIRYYPLGNDHTSTDMYDRSGNAKHAPIVGTGLSHVANEDNAVDQATAFDGASYVEIPTGTNGTDLNLNNYSYSFWMKADCQNNTDIQPVYRIGNDFNHGVFFVCTGSTYGIYAQVEGTTTTYYAHPISTTLDEGTWYHIAVTVTPLELILYINGTMKRNITIGDVSLNYGSTANSAYLGRKSASSPYYTGALDEFRLYNRQLSASEVSNIYSATITSHLNATDISTDALITKDKIVLPAHLSDQSYAIYSSDGRLMQQGNSQNHEIDIHTLGSGFYVVRLNAEIQALRFVK